MGIYCYQEIISNRELNKIKVPDDDFSFIYTAFQALYNLNTFKSFILKYESKSDIEIGKSLKEIFKRNINNQLIKNSKIIFYRIKEKNQNVANSPGKVIFQILDLLKQAHHPKNTNNTNIWNTNMNGINNNIENQNFFDYLEQYQKNSYCNNKIGEFFHIFFQKRIIQNNKINKYLYEYNIGFDLNLVDISKILISSRRMGINLQLNNFENINLDLLECISETLYSKFIFLNNLQFIEQKFLYTTPPYLIFILNRRRDGEYFNGKFTYSNEINLSNIVVRKDGGNIYKLSSIIKEKQNLNENEEKFNYITINRDEKGQFYYYEKNEKKSGMFDKNGFVEHVLIFKQLKINE